MQCVNNSVNFEFAKEQFVPSVQPSLTVMIITRLTPTIYSYASYTYLLQHMYAKHNRYILIPLIEDSSTPDYNYHRKLVPLMETLSPSAELSIIPDYVVWMDAGTNKY
jgi:hypothetical protein